MKYKSTKNILMRMIAHYMPQWQFSQCPNEFKIQFKTDTDGSDFSIQSENFNNGYDLIINGPKLERTVSLDDIFNIYPKEIFNHKYGLCFELKNGSSLIVGN